MTTTLHDRIAEILSAGLPDPRPIIADGRAIAGDVVLGRSRFCEEMGVASEAEYKARCKAEGVIMYHTHVGMDSWPATAAALRHLHRAATNGGYRLDRAGICLDRRMAVPEA